MFGSIIREEIHNLLSLTEIIGENDQGCVQCLFNKMISWFTLLEINVIIEVSSAIGEVSDYHTRI